MIFRIFILATLFLLSSCIDQNRSKDAKQDDYHEAEKQAFSTIEFPDFEYARVTAYTLHPSREIVEGPLKTKVEYQGEKKVGHFQLQLKNLSDNELILVKLEKLNARSSTHDPNTKTYVYEENNRKEIYSLAKASEWREGISVNPLTEISWRYTKNWIPYASPEKIVSRLNRVSEVLINSEKTGKNPTYKDLTSHRKVGNHFKDITSFNYSDLYRKNGYLESIKNGANSTTIQDELDKLFLHLISARLSSEIQNEPSVEIKTIGKGSVINHHLNLKAGSEIAPQERNVRTVVTNNTDPLNFYAYPTEDTYVAKWVGCDQVSKDNNKCTVEKINKHHVVEVIFSYRETKLSSHFLDASSASSEIDGNTLTLSVNQESSLLTKKLEAIKAGDILTIIADSTPKLIIVKTIDKTSHGDWQIDFDNTSISNLITQGTLLGSYKLRNSDLIQSNNQDYFINNLSVDPNNYHLPKSGSLRAKLIQPKNPSSTTFTLEIGISKQDLESQSLNDGAKWKLKDSEIEVVASFEFEIDIDIAWSHQTRRNIEDLRVVKDVRVKNIFNMGASGKFDIANELKGGELRKVLKTLDFKPIKFLIGVVPVYFTPKIEIVIGADGVAESKVSLSSEYSSSGRFSYYYSKDEGWTPSWTTDTEWNPLEPEIGADAKVRSYLAVEPQISIYDAVGPKLEIQSDLRLAAKEFYSEECGPGVDYGLWGGHRGNFGWSIPGAGTRFGDALGLDSFDAKIEFLSIEDKIYGGTLNKCGAEPAIMIVKGDSLSDRVEYRSGDTLTKQVTIYNSGDVTMPWEADYEYDNVLSVYPDSGNIEPNSSEVINIEIRNTAGLDTGLYKNHIFFKNNYDGGIGYSNIGSTTRNASIDIFPRTPPKPSILKAFRDENDESILQLEWTLLFGSMEGVTGFKVYYTEDENLVDLDRNSKPTDDWKEIGRFSAKQFSATLENVPKDRFFIIIDSIGDTEFFGRTSLAMEVPPKECGPIIEDRYQIFGEHCQYARDIVTRLEWQRFTFGQTWDELSHEARGSAFIYNHQEGIKAPDLQDPYGWRIPTNRELQSIVFCSSGIALNLSSGQEWSASLGFEDFPIYTVCKQPRQSPSLVESVFDLDWGLHENAAYFYADRAIRPEDWSNPNVLGAVDFSSGGISDMSLNGTFRLVRCIEPMSDGVGCVTFQN